jgi:hypothetical protein
MVFYLSLFNAALNSALRVIQHQQRGSLDDREVT